MDTKQIEAKKLNAAKKINLVNRFGGKCSMCGEPRHWMLEFHHKGDKEINMNEKWRRISVLEKEVDKCICVCSNCHREIHDSGKETQFSKAKIKMLEYKNTNCCSKCGYSKLNRVLDFHHIDPNTKDISVSKYRGSSKILTNEIKHELDKCIILCANCHREEHYDLDFFESNKAYILNKSTNIKEIHEAFDKEEILKLFDSGMRQIDIAKKLGAKKNTISMILKRFGKTTPMNTIKVDRDEFRQFVLAGNNSKKIQDKFNINKSTIFSICKELGIKITKISKEDPDNNNLKQRKCTLSDSEFIEACKTKTGSELAREFDTSPAAISLRKKRLGIR